mgnify:CR=1 FL=1
MQVIPTKAALGARVEGLKRDDIARPETAAALSKALADHLLLEIPGNPMTPEETRDFAAMFGKPRAQLLRYKRTGEVPEVSVMVSTLMADGTTDKTALRAEDWHTDDSYFATPAKATLLHSIHIPSSGGRTWFCNMRAAYEALPEATLEAGRSQVRDWLNLLSFSRANDVWPGYADGEVELMLPTWAVGASDEDDENALSLSALEEKLKPEVLRTLTKIYKVYMEMSKVQNRRLSTLGRGQKPSAEFEKSYEKHRKKIVELVRTVHINPHRIEQLKLSLYDLNKKLMTFEGRLLRLAESHRIQRQDFLDNYFNHELDPN